MIKKKKILFLLVLLSVFVINVKADTTPDVGFNFQGYDISSGASWMQLHAVNNTSDGGTITCGYSNASGNDLTDLNNGGNDIILIKYDKNGNKLWDQVYGGSKAEKAEDCFEDTDGNIVVVGGTQSSKSGEISSTNSDGRSNALIVKFDKDGNYIWDKQFDYSGKFSDSFKSIQETSDGNYILGLDSYKTDTFGYAQFAIVKVDKSGNTLWTFKFYAGLNQELSTVIETTPDTYIAVGNSRGDGDLTSHPTSDNIKPFILKVDKNGNKIIDKTYNFSNYVSTKALSVDDGIILLSFIPSTTNDYNAITKLDKDGNLLWNKVYKVNDIAGSLRNSINNTSDGGFIVSTSVDSAKNGIVINKFDKDGNLLWKSFKGNFYKNQQIYDILEVTPQNYVAVGFTEGGGLPFTFTINGSQAGLIVKNDFKPVIASDDEQTVSLNEVKTDEEIISLFNAKATDTEDGDLSTEIVVDQSKVDYTKLGTYDVTLTILDHSNIKGNDRKTDLNYDTKVVKLKVVNEPPTITANDDEYINLGTTLTDDQIHSLFKVSATDKEDGDLTSSVVIDSSSVDFSKAGDYPITFTVTDSIGQTTTETAILHIINEAPTITAIDDKYINLGTTLTDDQILSLFKVSATDKEDGDLTSSVVIDSSSVHFSKAGDYPITFTVTDSGGESVTKTVTLHISDEKPVITSDNKHKVDLNNKLSDDQILSLFNVSASDKEDGNLTKNVVIDSSSVDFSKVGVYQITLTVTDSNGNTTTKIVELEIVKNSKSTITGEDYKKHASGDKLEDADLIKLFNINANDSKLGNVNSKITVDQSGVDYDTPGEYKVIFSFIDSNGNKIEKIVTLEIFRSSFLIKTGYNNFISYAIVITLITFILILKKIKKA